MLQGHIHSLSFATTDSGCRDSVVALSADASKRYDVPEAAVTAIKTEDKTMAKGKTDKQRKQSRCRKRREKEKRGKGQWCRSRFLPSDLL